MISLKTVINRVALNMKFLLLVILLALGICTQSSSSTDQPVYFSLIVSSTSTFSTLDIIPAVDRTLELVCRNVTPSGHYLQYSEVLDIQVSCKDTMHSTAAIEYIDLQLVLQCHAMIVMPNEFILSVLDHNSATVKRL